MSRRAQSYIARVMRDGLHAHAKLHQQCCRTITATPGPLCKPWPYNSFIIGVHERVNKTTAYIYKFFLNGNGLTVTVRRQNTSLVYEKILLRFFSSEALQSNLRKLANTNFETEKNNPLLCDMVMVGIAEYHQISLDFSELGRKRFARLLEIILRTARIPNEYKR